MTFFKTKPAIVIFSTLLILSIAASMALMPNMAQVALPTGTHVTTYAFINVAPNPAGVGQTVTINFFLATPLETSERPTNMTVLQTNPDGTTKTLGPFTGDTTGGSFTTFIPDRTGNYTFQFFYGGQTLVGPAPPNGYGGLINDPSNSTIATLVVQEEPIQRSAYPITPLPNAWWETPVTAENVQEWYKITGPWLGFASNSFAATGSYNVSSYCNPYTPDVLSGHVLWTMPWTAGGVAGGDAGGTESSNYWSTSQYEPKYAPVVINGILYSTHYTTTTAYSNGIDAINLFTGQKLYTINTTNPLRCGMNTRFDTINQYGVVGPFIWTTGTLPGGPVNGPGQTQWNMYDANNGQYVLSLVNGSAMTLQTDAQGNLLGYFINNTAGTEMTHPTQYQNVTVTNTGPHLTCVNFTIAMGQTGQQFNPSVGTVRSMSNGVMWSTPVPTNISGADISPALAINSITGNCVVMTAGYIHGQGFGGEVAGWLVVASMDATTGAQVWATNLTSTNTPALAPYTRTVNAYSEGKIFIANMVNLDVTAYDVRTGSKVWENTLKGDNGATPNHYDLFNLKPYPGNGIIYYEGFGGDLWALNTADGTQKWYTNTTKLVGDPGIETPYDIWPLWVFNCACQTSNVGYFAIGHEYNPPLFHGAQLCCVNNTDGSLVWSTLDMSVTSTEISYGVLLSLNAYDNQLYAFGKGPSKLTVSAPGAGVTTAGKITISGTITDVSAGASQSAVAKNFPNGIPCVSDESQSHWMEYAYQQQPLPMDTTGVPITISVLDSNGNFRQIGSTTSSGGKWALDWTPDIAGNFQIIASFDGSNSYYPSSDSAYLYANEAATPGPSGTTGQGVDPTMTILGIGIAILIAVIIVGVVLALMIRRR